MIDACSRYSLKTVAVWKREVDRGFERVCSSLVVVALQLVISLLTL